MAKIIAFKLKSSEFILGLLDEQLDTSWMVLQPCLIAMSNQGNVLMPWIPGLKKDVAVEVGIEDIYDYFVEEELLESLVKAYKDAVDPSPIVTDINNFNVQ